MQESISKDTGRDLRRVYDAELAGVLSRLKALAMKDKDAFHNQDPASHLIALRTEIIQCCYPFPPATSKRRGVIAKVEIWLKKKIQRATHWYTWGQLVFNRKVVEILCEIIKSIEAEQDKRCLLLLERDLAGMNLQHRIASVESRLIELTAAVSAKTEGISVPEMRDQINNLTEEQRVSVKQLHIEIRELSSKMEYRLLELQKQLNALETRIANYAPK